MSWGARLPWPMPWGTTAQRQWVPLPPKPEGLGFSPAAWHHRLSRRGQVAEVLVPLGGLSPPGEVSVSPECWSSSSPSQQQSVAGCRPGETLCLACPPFAACSGRMIAALCKLPHPRSRGQVSAMAQTQSSSGEPCAAALLCALRRCPGVQLGAAQAPAWGWLCPTGRRCPREPLSGRAPAGAPSPCGTWQPSGSAEPEPVPGQGSSRRLLPRCPHAAARFVHPGSVSAALPARAKCWREELQAGPHGLLSTAA